MGNLVDRGALGFKTDCDGLSRHLFKSIRAAFGDAQRKARAQRRRTSAARM